PGAPPRRRPRAPPRPPPRTIPRLPPRMPRRPRRLRTARNARPPAPHVSARPVLSRSRSALRLEPVGSHGRVAEHGGLLRLAQVGGKRTRRRVHVGVAG